MEFLQEKRINIAIFSAKHFKLGKRLFFHNNVNINILIKIVIVYSYSYRIDIVCYYEVRNLRKIQRRPSHQDNFERSTMPIEGFSKNAR